MKTLAVYPAENDGARKLISRVEPVCPVVLLSNHIGGTVRLRVTVARTGAVEDVDLLGGNPIRVRRQWLQSSNGSTLLAVRRR